MDKILTDLRRYSFEEKMRVAQIYSRKLLSLKNTHDSHIMRSIPYPWELETFVLFAVKSIEWKFDTFSDKNMRKFYEIIHAIRDADLPISEEERTNHLVKWLVPVTALTQFDSQEVPFIKMFRFSYYFSFLNDKIDMRAEFRRKFGCDYSEFSALGYMLFLIFNLDITTSKSLQEVLAYFPIPVSQLTLTRDNYIAAIDKATTDIAKYTYCLRPSYSYPFIMHNDILFCPLPHLLIRATTSSLMHRLTNGNDSLMKLIGKEVYESYLFMIINESSLFDEVYPEQSYTSLHNNEERTIDVMACKGNDYVFFDCKSFSPKADIRIFSETAYEADTIRLAKACEQMYNHIHTKFPHMYCPFGTVPEEGTFNIYGFVVVQEDPHLNIDGVLNETAKRLKIKPDSMEFDWIKHHIGVISLYMIELYCFSKTDICEAIRVAEVDEKSQHLQLSGKMNPDWKYQRYNSVLDKLGEKIQRIASDIFASERNE